MNKAATRTAAWLGLVVGAALASAPSAAAQTPAAAPTVMDVTVIDARGEPMLGLTPDRFRVEVGGRPQKVVSADLVHADPAAGRSVMIVVDQSSIEPGAEAPLVAVARALVRRLAATDRVGLLSLPAPGPRIPLTADHASVVEALGETKGRRSLDSMSGRIGLGEALAISQGDAIAMGVVTTRECGGVGDTIKSQNGPKMEMGVFDQAVNDCFHRVTRTTDRLIAEAGRASETVIPGVVDALNEVGGAPGARAVVLVTSGLVTGRRDPALVDMTTRAASTGASVHALLVDPAVQKGRGVPISRPTERRGLTQRLNELTIAARGHAELATPDDPETFDRLLRETGGYYKVGVAVQESASRDPRQAGVVRVEVSGARLTVRARPFLFDSTSSAGPSGPMSREDRIAEALGMGGVRASVLPVRGAAALRVGANKSASLVISGEVDPAKAEGADASGGELSMSYALFDQQKQPVAAGSLPGRPPAKNGSRSFLGQLRGIEPGRYTLRFAAMDTSGRMGSVERDVDIRLTESGGLTAGDIVLARAVTDEAVPAVDEIAVDAAILMQVDVGGDRGARSALSGRFVVRPRDSAVAVLTLPATHVANDDAGFSELVARLEPGLLTPGDYVVVAELKSGAAAFSTGARPLILAPASGAAATGRPTWLAALTPPFSRARVLDPAVLKPVITRLQARATAPAVQAALAKALDGKPEALTVDNAVRAQDPVAAAFLRGLAHFAKAELEPAAQQFREALRLDAEFAPAIVYLGACYAAGGRDQEAAGAWQTALISEDEGAVLPALLAEAWLRADDADAAIEILDEAAAKWPEDRDLSAGRVTALLAAGKTADALTALDGLKAASADQLFAAMRVLVDAHTRSQAVVSAAEDRRRLAAYAERYKAANGPQQPLVASWLSSWPE